MPFLYGTELQIKEVIIKKEIETIIKKNNKWNSNWKFWLQLSAGIATTLLYFIPGIGSFAKMLIDVSANMLLDTIFAVVEKQSSEEILTNFALNLIPPTTKILRNMSKLRKTKAFFASQFIDRKLNKSVNLMLKNEKIFDTYSMHKIYKSYSNKKMYALSKEKMNLLKNYSYNWNTKFELFNKSFNKFSKTLSFTTNIFRSITNSRYSTQKIGQIIFEKTGAKFGINKLINNFQKNIWKKLNSYAFKKKSIQFKKRFLTIKRIWKKTKTIALPLNHTLSSDIGGWIQGVRIKESSIPNYFHIKWIFHPKYNKPNITSFNKPYKFLIELFNSESAGKFYLDNISFGWDFKNIWGSHSKKNLFFSKNWKTFSYIAFMPKYLSFITRIYRTFKTFLKIKEINNNYLNKQWNSEKINEYFKSIFFGGILGIKIPGKNFLKKMYATINSNNPKYLANYFGRNFLKKNIQKSQKYLINKKALKW